MYIYRHEAQHEHHSCRRLDVAVASMGPVAIAVQSSFATVDIEAVAAHALKALAHIGVAAAPTAQFQCPSLLIGESTALL